MYEDIHISPYVTTEIDDDICKILIENGRKTTLKKKEYFLRQGVIQSFVFVASGLLGRVRDTYLEHKQTHLEIIPPNRVANFMNFFSPGKARISIISLRNSTVYITPFDQVRKSIAQDPDMISRFAQMYGGNMETALRSCYCNFIFPCEHRLIHLFKAIIRTNRLSPDKEGWYLLPYKLTREEYSQVIFSSLLSVDNIFSDWKKKGLYRKSKEGSFVHADLLSTTNSNSLDPI